MNMLGSKTKETVPHGRANLFITTKLNFPLTAPCSEILGVLLSVTYGSVGGRGESTPKMSIEIVSVRGKACLISAHLDFMTALRSALPDREHYSCILS